MKDSNNSKEANNSGVIQSNEQFLDLSSKSITDGNKVLQEIYKAYPNVEQIDLSDNKLMALPEDLSMFKSLKVLDIRMNPFENVSNTKAINC